MKKSMSIVLLMLLTLGASAQKKAKQDGVMTKQNGQYVVNTTTLCQAKGFKDITPLKVTFNKEVIVKVEALPNKETPSFFDRITKELLPKYELLKISEQDKVDAVSGATMSSRAVKANVKAACDYYKANKAKK
ncbi:MAG: FMN-binding protein [Bacteroidaceae bacterium]|nr:FMN-binding protein [Bacteroidaceae bacterium]